MSTPLRGRPHVNMKSGGHKTHLLWENQLLPSRSIAGAIYCKHDIITSTRPWLSNRPQNTTFTTYNFTLNDAALHMKRNQPDAVGLFVVSWTAPAVTAQTEASLFTADTAASFFFFLFFKDTSKTLQSDHKITWRRTKPAACGCAQSAWLCVRVIGSWDHEISRAENNSGPSPRAEGRAREDFLTSLPKTVGLQYPARSHDAQKHFKPDTIEKRRV